VSVRALWLVGVFGLVSCDGPAPTAPIEPVVQPLDAASLAAVTTEITDLGSRMVATPAELEGVALVEALFADAGLVNVHREGFQWEAWAPGAATLTLDDGTPEGQVLPAKALSPTPPTAGLSAPIEVGGDPEGTFLVVTDQGTSRGAQAFGAASQGAAGMIRVTEATMDDGDLLVEVGHTLVGLTLPSVAVDAEVGAILRANEGATVTLDADTLLLPEHTSYNVLGEVPGTTDRTLYVTAHIDSWDPSHSAADNAIGVAAMVLMARRLANSPVQPEPTVVFLATGAEEQGLQGALAYTDAHPDRSEDADLVLNLDVMWAQEGTFLVMSDDAALGSLALDVATEEGLEPVDAGVPSPSSDNFPFQILGVPAFWSGRFGYRQYHTHADVIEDLDFDGAAAALRVQWAVLAEATGVPR
jgi:Iap family predicted aminopeptidase